jgi:hypothetical protein
VFFTGLYYASRHWIDPALALILFGSCFMVTLLLFADTSIVGRDSELPWFHSSWSLLDYSFCGQPGVTMWLLRGRLLPDAALPWYSLLSELKLSKRLLTRTTGLR